MTTMQTFLAAILIATISSTSSVLATPPTYAVNPLPYAPSALEPAISNRTMSFHYGKHYPTYIANLNTALMNDSSVSNSTTLSSVIKGVDKNGPAAVRNNGGGAYNHALYFNQFRAASNGSANASLPAELKKEIDLSFPGGFEEMIQKLEAAGTGVFGSGWSWLVWTGDKKKPLAVETTPNQDNPMMKKLGYSGHIPVLGIDVWEHSYYLDYQNLRPKHLAAVLGDGKDPSTGIIDWEQVEKNLKAAEKGDAEEAIKPRAMAKA